jgi:hypothetical protein
MLLEHVYLFTTTRGLMFIVLSSSFSLAKVNCHITSDDNLYTCLDRDKLWVGGREALLSDWQTSNDEFNS